jgi:Dehydrogenases with different specificities (related to short-chain alcohol dehydrogenases)
MSSAEYSMASLSDIFRLDGKVAVVVGGAGGIGKFLVEALSAYGAKVVIADLVPLDKSKDLARKISERTGREIGALQFDATDEAQVAKARDEVVSKYGTVDILVNSQGINIKYPALEFPVNDWDRMYAVNVKSLMLTSREFGRVMVEKRYGKIINMSSVRDSRATKWGGQHSVLLHEGAVAMLTRQLAAEWAPYGVRVNAIGPALVSTETGMGAGLTSSDHIRRYLDSIPLGRIAVPEDHSGCRDLPGLQGLRFRDRPDNLRGRRPDGDRLRLAAEGNTYSRALGAGGHGDSLRVRRPEGHQGRRADLLDIRILRRGDARRPGGRRDKGGAAAGRQLARRHRHVLVPGAQPQQARDRHRPDEGGGQVRDARSRGQIRRVPGEHGARHHKEVRADV